MASIGFLIGGAIINALAFSGSNFCSVLYLKNQSTKNERDTIKLSKVCNELAKKRQERSDYIDNEIMKKT